ncbi:hypothetical protein Tco_1442349 [Tanacetum coccineum]
MLASCHEPNSERSGSSWKTYMNARVAGLFLLVLLEYPNGKGVVHATSRGLDMALHCSQYRIRWKPERVMDYSKWWMTVAARWILSRKKEKWTNPRGSVVAARWDPKS